MNNKFFLFGCWNHDNCDGNNHRDNVLQMIEMERNSYDFGIITGDNIYPQKDKKTKEKNYYKSTFDSLKKLLKLVPKKVLEKEIFLNIILGNHDIDSKCVYDNEIKILSKMKNTKLYLENKIIEKENAYYIFLNTNESELEKLKVFFVNELLQKPRDPNKWFIFVGHEPLYSFKYKIKKGKHPNYTELDPELIELFNNLYQFYKKMVYLCADTHNFQLINVTSNMWGNLFNIPIVVVGTGGAKLDSILEIDSEYKNELEYSKLNNTFFINQYDNPHQIKENINDDNYTIYLEHYIKRYGFASLEVSDNVINIEFKTCDKNYLYNILYDNMSEQSYVTSDFNLKYKYNRSKKKIKTSCKRVKTVCDKKILCSLSKKK